MASITKEMILSQIGNLREEKAATTNALHRIAGAEKLCEILLEQLAAMEDQEKAKQEEEDEQSRLLQKLSE